jgi:hypothetical protein
MQLALRTKEDNWGEHYLPQQMFNPDEMGLKCNNEVEAVVTPYR